MAIQPHPDPIAATDLKKRLEASHLPSASEIQTEIEEAQKKEKPKTDLNNPKAQRDYTFQFDYTDARGGKWEGEFTHSIPTLAKRDVIDLIQARKKSQLPVESFTAMAAMRHLYVSHLTVCLTSTPKWAENLEELLDPEIVAKLYDEAASHEAYFLGWGKDSGGSKA